VSHIALCRPDHFDVSYRINPWMDPAGWSTGYAALAKEQWQGLHKTLSDLGVRLEMVPPVAGLPDMVFTANGGLVLDRTVLLPNFRHPERQGETPHFAAFFERLKALGMVDRIHRAPENIAFEGAGDCLWDPARQMFWAGWGQRSSHEAVGVVQNIFGKRVTGLELVDPRFYHLDVSLRPLARGHLLYYPAAFSAEGRKVIEAQAGGADYLIPVDDADAAAFAVNAVAIGDDIIVSSVSDALRGKLRGAGYRVHETPLWAFHRSGGSALCLTLRLDQKSKALEKRSAA
jgi:N-dimethylarginine dimethylaminohydrolase